MYLLYVEIVITLQYIHRSVVVLSPSPLSPFYFIFVKPNLLA